jgi:hypothetical protein
MNDTTYNGWTNYATWRVNLEIFDGYNYEEHGFHGLSQDDPSDVYDLAEHLKEWANECIEFTSPSGLARDYAFVFMQDVNYLEIAKNMIEEDQE